METETKPTTTPEVHLDDLKAIRILGKGAMGTVFLVHHRHSDPSALRPFALKVVDKSSFATKFDAQRRAHWEISVLSRLDNHPFLPTLLYTHGYTNHDHDHDNLLAWAIPYCSGADLNLLRHRQTDHVFSPSVIRFYVAQILSALQHLHELSIVYRDLKPENVLITHSGHVCLTDFDLSRHLSRHHHQMMSERLELGNTKKKHNHHRRNLTRIVMDTGLMQQLKKVKSARVSPVSRRKPSFSSSGERSNSFVGTEEYVSPEMVCGDGHEFAVDWWALGVLMYEMLYGKTPFRGSNRKETFRNVLMKQPEFVGKRTGLIDLIERLLEKDPTKRLGYYGGAEEIREHEFFRGLRWEMLTEVSRPPFLPPVEDSVTVTGRGRGRGTEINIREYFQKKPCCSSSVPPSPSRSTLRSQSSGWEERDEEEGEELTEF